MNRSYDDMRSNASKRSVRSVNSLLNDISNKSKNTNIHRASERSSRAGSTILHGNAYNQANGSVV